MILVLFYELATFRGALLENPKSFYKNQGLKTSYGALKTGLDLENTVRWVKLYIGFVLQVLYG